MLQILVLERVEPERNVHRYYVLAVEPTLFGDMALRREWGRLGHRGGARRLDLFADLDGAREALGTWLRRKRRRGYSVVDAPSLPLGRRPIKVIPKSRLD